jgi:organic radical activating enzyme
MRTINIQNVRMGFNTSSSSQHSAVLNVNPELVSEPDGGFYGWNNFILKTADEKEHYFAMMLFCNLSGHMPASYAKAVVNSLFDKPILKKDEDEDGGFDHGSVLSLPRKHEWWTRPVDEIDWEFFQDLKGHIVDNPNIAICGGNDNDKRPHYGKEEPIYQKIFRHMADTSGPMVARKDGEFWVIFNKRTGTKLRLSFTSKARYTKSSLPESADIKITDFCPFECDFCYQDSTIEGKFSNPSFVGEIARVLGNMGVFEVAIGGGEPTFHPSLGKIIDNFYHKGICVNLTTRSKAWLDNPPLSKIILERVSGLAFSVGGSSYQSYYDIEDVASWLRRHHYKGELSVHYVLGTGSTDQVIRELTRLATMTSRITLLGFKQTGRARNYQPNKINMQEILEHCRSHYYTLGLDTKAVQDYKQEIRKAKISKVLVTEKEGKFSLYIDAVQRFIAPDSYSATSKNIPFSIEYNKTDSLQKVIEENFPF